MSATKAVFVAGAMMPFTMMLLGCNSTTSFLSQDTSATTTATRTTTNAPRLNPEPESEKQNITIETLEGTYSNASDFEQDHGMKFLALAGVQESDDLEIHSSEVVDANGTAILNFHLKPPSSFENNLAYPVTVFLNFSRGFTDLRALAAESLHAQKLQEGVGNASGRGLRDQASHGNHANCRELSYTWYDSDGPDFDCAWYSGGNRCEAYGDGYARHGHTANTACCACGKRDDKIITRVEEVCCNLANVGFLSFAMFHCALRVTFEDGNQGLYDWAGDQDVSYRKGLWRKEDGLWHFYKNIFNAGSCKYHNKDSGEADWWVTQRSPVHVPGSWTMNSFWYWSDLRERSFCNCQYFSRDGYNTLTGKSSGLAQGLNWFASWGSSSSR